MAFSPDNIETAKKTVLSDYLDDDGTFTDQTSCLTNGDTATSCEELNGEAEAHRVEVNLPKTAWSAFTLRVHCNSVMTSGNVALLAYTDSNSVTATAKNVVAAATAYFDLTGDASFMAELGDVGGGNWAVRVVTDDGQSTKYKVCEYEFEPTWVTAALTGYTYDNDGVALGSQVVQAFKVISTGPLVLANTPFDTDTSNAVTGAYSLDLYAADWVLIAFDAGSPNKMDISEIITHTIP